MGPYVFLNAVLVGVFASAAVFCLWLWRLSRRERTLLVFALHCSLCAVWCVSVIAIAQARTIDAIQAALDARTTVGVLGIISTAWLLTMTTGVRARPFVWFVTAALVLVAVANLLVLPINGTVTGIDRVRTSWDEEISIPRRGPPGWWGGPIYAVILAVNGFGLFAAYRLGARDRVGGILVGLASGGGLIAAVAAVAIDMLRKDLPYFGSIPYAFWVAIIAVMLSREYRQRDDKFVAGEQRFRAIFDQTFQFVGLTRADGTLIQANRTALEFAGIEASEAIGKPIWETQWWAHSPGLQERLKKAVRDAATGEVVRFEATHLGPSGRMAHVDFSLKPVLDERGQITLLIAEGRDVTERHCAEEALREREAFLRMAQTVGHIGNWEWELATNRVRWSEEMARIHGIRLDQFDGTLDMAGSFFHPDDMPRLQDSVRGLLAGGEFQQWQYRIRRPGGEIRFMWPMGEIIRDALGQPQSVFGVVVDITERVLAEGTVRQSEERHRLLTEHAHVVLWECDPATFNFTHVSEFAESLLGFPRADWYRAGFWLDHLHPDDRDAAFKFCLEAAEAQRDHRFEYRMIHADGRVVWVDDVVKVIVADNRIAAMRGVLIDITERKRTEKTLRESRAHLVASQRIARVGSWEIEIRGESIVLLHWSDECFRVFGYEPGEVEANSPAFWNRVHPDDQPVVKRAIRRAIDDLSVYEIEHRAVMPDGSERIIHERGELALDLATGKPSRITGTSQDVTDRVQAAAALRTSEARSRAILGALPDLMFRMKADGTILDYSAADSSDLFAAPEAFLGRRIDDVLPAAVGRLCQTHRRLALATRKAQRFEYDLEIPGKGKEYFEARVTASSDDETITIVRNITERVWAEETRRKLEEDLLQSQKMQAIGLLAGGVAHDFNNLLTVISGHSELLLDVLPSENVAREPVKAIKEASDRAAALTQQLLVFGRKHIYEPRVLDPNAIVAQTERMLRRVIGEDIRFSVRLDPGVGRVKADPAQLDQVLMNLVVNARDAMPAGGSLTIETRSAMASLHRNGSPANGQAQSCAVLAVSDTGVGMTQEVAARIFEPFYTTKGVGKGTGLGLAVVHGIVEQSGGRIEVVSNPGVGTTISIYLPEVAEEPKAVEIGDKQPPRGGTETLLLVEDEEIVRKLAATVLEAHGYRVLQAVDGLDALRLAEIQTGPIDMLLTDVVMPNMNGLELAEKIRQRFPGIKVMFMSGYPSDAIDRRGIARDDMVLLQKPYAPDALARMVRQVLDRN